jgi:hypothetical protein
MLFNYQLQNFIRLIFIWINIKMKNH